MNLTIEEIDLLISGLYWEISENNHCSEDKIKALIQKLKEQKAIPGHDTASLP